MKVTGTRRFRIGRHFGSERRRAFGGSQVFNAATFALIWAVCAFCRVGRRDGLSAATVGAIATVAVCVQRPVPVQGEAAPDITPRRRYEHAARDCSRTTQPHCSTAHCAVSQTDVSLETCRQVATGKLSTIVQLDLADIFFWHATAQGMPERGCLKQSCAGPATPTGRALPRRRPCRGFYRGIAGTGATISSHRTAAGPFLPRLPTSTRPRRRRNEPGDLREARELEILMSSVCQSQAPPPPFQSHTTADHLPEEVL